MDEKTASPNGPDNTQKYGPRFKRIVATILLLCVLAISQIWPDLLIKSKATSTSKKNIIFMVSDGMGPASLSLARSFKQYRDDLPYDFSLQLDKCFIGSSRTRSDDSLVTDSAAGATAFSCGLKSYNGAIGVDSDQKPCGTILEALKLSGYMTGLVVTTRITDATPAAFSAHVDYRFQEDLIAQHQLGEYTLGRQVDLILGGGRCHYHPRSLGGCRADNRDLIAESVANGWLYVGDKAGFDGLKNGTNVKLPLLGLLAENDIPFSIDHDPAVHPSLAEQVKVAVTALEEATKDSPHGFFLLIEGSRIDHAGHYNDPAAQVREVLAYDEAFEVVQQFIDESDTPTIAISTSDHETGGLATARQVTPGYPDYLWLPQVLLNSTRSGEYLASQVVNHQRQHGAEKLSSFIEHEIFVKSMGLGQYSQSEVDEVCENSHLFVQVLNLLNNMISVRSQTGWSTHGHSAVDVNIYGYTNSNEMQQLLNDRRPYHGLFGNHENIEIGRFMERLAGVDLAKVTEKVKDVPHAPVNAHVMAVDEMHPRFD